MSEEILDRLTLDAMLSGDEEVDQSAWLALLSSPDAPRLWDEALARRRSLDRLAGIVRAHPWLAGPILKLKRARRKVSAALSPQNLNALKGALEGAGQFEAVLGEGEVQTIDVSWSSIQVVMLEEGEKFLFRAPEGARIFYQWEEQDGELVDQAWEMESGESPVVLTLFLPEEGLMTFEEYRDSGAPRATVILIEKVF